MFKTLFSEYIDEVMEDFQCGYISLIVAKSKIEAYYTALTDISIENEAVLTRYYKMAENAKRYLENGGF